MPFLLIHKAHQARQLSWLTRVFVGGRGWFCFFYSISNQAANTQIPLFSCRKENSNIGMSRPLKARKSTWTELAVLSQATPKAAPLLRSSQTVHHIDKGHQSRAKSLSSIQCYLKRHSGRDSHLACSVALGAPRSTRSLRSGDHNKITPA